jgi:hypothetical protein
MGTASEATPPHNGHLRRRMLKIVAPCSSTYLSKGTSHIHKKHNMRLVARAPLDLRLLEVLYGSYVQLMNHSTVMIIADHGQIIKVTIFLRKMG